MTLSYRRKNGAVDEAKQFDAGCHLAVPFKSGADFCHLSKFAHAARLVPEGGKNAKMVSFGSLEEV